MDLLVRRLFAGRNLGDGRHASNACTRLTRATRRCRAGDERQRPEDSNPEGGAVEAGTNSTQRV